MNGPKSASCRSNVLANARASADETGPRPALVWGMSPTQLAWVGVALVTLLRFWYMCRYDLVPDEAKYWVWSKHLALCYRDKGPLVAWTIALGTRLFGDTVVGVRFFAVLLSAATAFQLFRLARRLYDDRAALWCLVVTTTVPLFAIGAILMTIDPLSVFFWAWGANLSWRAYETGRMRYWWLLGAAIGIGFLAKFINAVQLLCVAMFLGWSRPHRHLLFSRQTLAMLLAFCVTALPVFVWNAQTGWLNVQALHERSGIHQSFAIRPIEVLRYLAGQLGAITPLIWIGMVVGAVGLWRFQSDQARVKHLLSQFVPIQSMYLLLSLNSRVEPNWIAPSLIAGVVLLVAFWRQLILRSPKWRWTAWSALGFGLVTTLLLHAATFFSLPLKIDLMRRGEGWLDFAQHVQQARQKTHANLLIANHSAQASIMQFYLPDRPFAYLPPAPYGESQFTLWPGYIVVPGTRALYVTDSRGPLPQQLKAEFTRWELLDAFWSQYHGRDTTHFQIFLLSKD
jgi:4-amino-4-deoxy-L-arabinose transferase-like glycosyltransferase